jgi:hypothetical protein
LLFLAGCKPHDFGDLLAAETGSPLASLYLNKVATKRKNFFLEICLLAIASGMTDEAVRHIAAKACRRADLPHHFLFLRAKRSSINQSTCPCARAQARAAN